MMLKRTLALGVACVALGGCTTHLGIKPLDAGSDLVAGVPYPLHFDQFDVTTNYELVACGLEPTLKITAAVGDRVGIPDPDHIYVVDPDSLASFLKTSEFTVEYNPDLSIKSINATADDRTAETIGSLAKSAAGIVKIVAAGGYSPSVVRSGELCTAEAVEAVDKVAAQREVLKGAVGEHALTQAAFDRAKARIDATGGAADEELRRQFSDAYRRLQFATDRLSAAKKTLEGLAGDVTYSRTFRWPERGTEVSRTVEFDQTIEAETFGKWLKPRDAGDDGSTDSQGLYDIQLAIAAAAPSRLVAPNGSAELKAEQLAEGIPYRMATPGMLTVRLPHSRDDDGQLSPTVLFEKSFPLRQLGRVFALPCTSAPFTKIGCSLAFDESGRLIKVGKTNAKAPGEAAAGLFETLVAQGDVAATALRERQERREGEEKAEQEERLALLELEKKIRDAENALVVAAPTARQQIENEILDYDADRRLLEARRKLDEERALAGG